MPVLHLGVIDIPYSHGNSEESGAKSTGDVAEILEAKYNIMRVFFNKHQQEIADVLLENATGVLENMLTGAPPPRNAFLGGTEKIREMFRSFLDMKEMDGEPGVPTAAAMKGVSHRFKHPNAKRGPRPSFIDTGMYQKSFTCSVDDKD